VERSLQTAIEAGLHRAACRAYANLGMLYGALNHEKALEYCQRGLELAHKVGDLTIESWLRSSMASTFCTLGVDWVQGVQAAEAAIDLDRQLGYRSHLPVPLILMAQIYQCHGVMDAAEHYYREALQVAQELDEPQYLFPIYEGLAAARVVAGDEAGAAEMQDRAKDVLDRAGYSPETLLALPFLT
jgi:adenylate cyclase